MGTFIILPTTVTAQTAGNCTWNLTNAASAIDASLTKGDGKWVNTGFETGFNPVTALLRLGTSGNNIFLDGSGVGIGFAGLPAGFSPATVQVDFSGQVSHTNSGNAFLQFDSFTESLQIGDVFLNGATVSYVHPGNVPSILDIYNNGMGIRYQGVFGASGLIVDFLQISGTYNIVSSSWALSPKTGVKSGDKVTIGSTILSGPGSLAGLSRINIQYIDSNNNTHTNSILAQDFAFYSPSTIIFYMPQFGGLASNSTVSIYGISDGISGPPLVDINGVQFFGSVFLGTMTITLVDASGIYQLVPYKSTDTIYDRNTPGATKEVNILDPTITTALLP